MNEATRLHEFGEVKFMYDQGAIAKSRDVCSVEGGECSRIVRLLGAR